MTLSRNESLDLPVLTEGPFFWNPQKSGEAIQALTVPNFLRPIVAICRSLSIPRMLEVAGVEHRVLEEDFGVPVVPYKYGFVPVELVGDQISIDTALENQRFFHGRFLPDGMILGASVDVVNIDPSIDPVKAFHDVQPKITQYYISSMESNQTGYGLQDIDDIQDYVSGVNGMTLVDIEPKLSETLETMTVIYSKK